MWVTMTAMPAMTAQLTVFLSAAGEGEEGERGAGEGGRRHLD